MPALALAVAACDDTPDQRSDAGETTTPAPISSSANLAQGTLGTVHYSYDPATLTRAEVDLALPPQFEHTVFAIKFIPTSLAAKLGEDACSFGSMSDGHSCSANVEVGFALALLERPLADYTTALARATPAQGALESVSVNGHEGMSFVHQSAHTTTRYTFLPANGRTLLLADRFTDGIDTGREALEQVRASIQF